MNEALIERWNARVTSKDDIYHLGDFSFAGSTQTLEWLRRLNGRKYFLHGNHDPKNMGFMANDLIWSSDYAEIKVNRQKLVLFHYPIGSWNGMHHGTWHLHGHSHGNYPHNNQPMMDVGVDATVETTNYAPISFEEIVTILSQRTFTPVDHHRS